MPTIINVTILNGLGVSGHIVGKPQWHPYLPQHGHLLDVAIAYSEVLWPWSGWLAISLSVSRDGNAYEGLAQGHIALVVESLLADGETERRHSTITLPIR